MNKTIILPLLSVLTACAPRTSTISVAPSPANSFEWSRQDVIVADSTVGQMPVTKTMPSYPMGERMHGVEAAFVTVFVLDTLGRVELESVSFLENPPSAFAESVCEYFRHVRYLPMRVGGIGKPALVVVPWVFSLEGGKWQNKTLDVSGLRENFRKEGADSALAELQGLSHCQR